MVNFKLDKGVDIPAYQTEGASGFDVCANSIKMTSSPTVKTIDSHTVNIPPGERVLFGTGITVASMDSDLEIQVRSRSGIALKQGLIVGNSPGTVDSDYRGEIGIIIINTSNQPVQVKFGTRIAQLVIAQSLKHEFDFVDDIEESSRGGKGFGSTGLT